MKTPYVPQLSDTDCGPAALAAIACSYGKTVTVADIATACETGRDGTSLAVLRAGARSLGLDASVVRVAPTRNPSSSIASIGYPHIALLNRKHFVVVEQADRRHVHINDPARGRHRIPASQYAAEFTGLALRVAPGPSFTTGGQPVHGPVREWWSQEPPRDRLRLAASSLLAVLSSLAVIAVVISVRTNTDSAKTGWLALAAVYFGWAAAHLRSGALYEASLRRTADFVAHLTHLSPRFLDRRFTAEVAMRPQRVDMIATSMVTLVSDGLSTAVVCAVLAVALGTWAPWALVVVAVGAGLAWASLGLRPGTRRDLQDAHTAARQVRDGEIVSTLRTLESLRAEAAADAIAQRWIDAQQAASEAEEHLHRHASLRQRTASAIETATLISVVATMHSSPVAAAAAILLASLLLSTFRRLVTTQLVDLTEVASSKRLVDDVLAQDRYELPGAHSTTTDPSHAPVLRAAALAYRRASYHPNLFGGLDLEVRRGEQVFVVGPSGVGKSTLARILVGALEPSEGCVIRRGTTAYVPQRPVFLDGTIRDNILFGTKATDQAILDVLHLVELDRVISLRGGLDAPVIQAGANFSGGERQRLALARALLRQPDILVLDEALSALDRDLADRLAALVAHLDGAVISICHDLPPVGPRDRVLALDTAGLRQLHPALAAIDHADESNWAATEVTR